MERIAKLEKDYVNTLPEHKAFITKVVSPKVDVCEEELELNDKVYRDSAASIGEIPPLGPIPFAPPLEFMPPNYMNMINSPH